MTTQITSQSIINGITNSDAWVNRAVIALGNLHVYFQTNGIMANECMRDFDSSGKLGFNAHEVTFMMSLWHQVTEKGRTLSAKQISAARKVILKNHNVEKLVMAAKEKANA